MRLATPIHQAVDLVYCHKVLQISGRHGHEHMPFAVAEGFAK